MVEGLKYYQDSPDKESEKEAIEISRSGDDYYRPFFNNPKKINVAPPTPTGPCPFLNEPYSCLQNPLCTWDSSLVHCYFR